MFSRALGASSTVHLALDLDVEEESLTAEVQDGGKQLVDALSVKCKAILEPKKDTEAAEGSRSAVPTSVGARAKSEDFLREGIKRELQSSSQDASPEEDLSLSRITVKAKLNGFRVASSGMHAASVEGSTLAWAVLRPSSANQSSTRYRQMLRRPKRPEGDAAAVADNSREHVSSSFRGSRKANATSTVQPRESSKDASASALRLHEKATSLLSAALGDSADASSTATALATAFLAREDAKQRLLALGAALRNNPELSKTVLAAGPEGAPALARQDPREWAGAEMQAKRQRWAKESLQEAQVPLGQMATCPECGGRAFVNTGRAGSGRAARLSKQYAHFTCTEKTCGKVTHVQEG
eukprot:TRINITY_DN81050_c0_g1_i1.p1 TRINITY_DN81050_c0_g1~~TRINITY_DN81050_c0_g1_i1.p1  ORF type:complete len:355 (-),score=75.90 TRINITY_DN81050_c0_g1_i1:21-1085(-)